MDLQSVLILVAAGVLVLGLGAVLWRLRGLSGLADAERRALEDKIAEREGRLHEATERLRELEAAHDRLAVEAAEARTALRERDEAFHRQTEELGAARERAEGLAEELAQARADLSRLQETLTQERKSGQEKLDTLLRAREEMTAQFKALAGEIMKQHGEDFSKASAERLESFLNPLRERIEGFQKRVNEIYADETKGRTELATQIRHLMELNARMSEEANNLTKALKGQSQVQGAWGEMILERILESSGLRKGEEYITQDTHTDDESRRLRPDVVVRLPGDRYVIIDSKVSLTAYERYCSAEDETLREQALKQHVASIRNHIATLARKDYAGVVHGSIDYVLMFIPIEGAFSAALAADRELTELAIASRVGLTTPTTLTTALRTVHHLWQVERRNAGAQKIAEEAGRMYDKFVGFVEDMNRLGEQIGRVQQTHSDAMNKLTTGRGNLVRRLEKLRDMGIAPKKDIPAKMLDSAGLREEDLREEEADATATALTADEPTREEETPALPLASAKAT